jgi:hypothetical protein
MKKIAVILGLLFCLSASANTVVTITLNSSLAQAVVKGKLDTGNKKSFLNTLQTYLNGINGGAYRAAVTVKIGSLNTVSFNR